MNVSTLPPSESLPSGQLPTKVDLYVLALSGLFRFRSSPPSDRGTRAKKRPPAPVAAVARGCDRP